jgi:uncharacterized protein (TIGR03084 family)
MASVFEEVIDDLAEEHRALERVLDRLAPSVFEKATHAIGWAVRDQVAHLAHFDEAAALAITDAEALREHFRRPENGEPAYLERARTLTHGDLLEWWRTASSNLRAALKSLDPAARIPWAGPPMSGVSHVTARLMETWSHGLDVVDVAGVERPDTDRLRHVAFLGVRTRPYSYQTRNLEPSRVPVRVSLTAPSGATWELGDDTNENVVRGSATDFCRVVTQRRHIADTSLEVIGDAAREWMGIAQAFAGPPGAGRQPGEFPREAKR